MNGTHEFLIRESAPEVADQIRKAADWAESEADLQLEVEKLLDSFRTKTGIKIDQFANRFYGLANEEIKIVNSTSVWRFW